MGTYLLINMVIGLVMMVSKYIVICYLWHLLSILILLGFIIMVDPQPDGLVLTFWDVSLFVCLFVVVSIYLLINT